MTVLQLMLHTYNPSSRMQWEIVDISVDQALRDLAGKVTIMFQWEEGNRIYGVTIPAYDDTLELSKKLAAQIVQELKSQFSK